MPISYSKCCLWSACQHNIRDWDQYSYFCSYPIWKLSLHLPSGWSLRCMHVGNCHSYSLAVPLSSVSIWFDIGRKKNVFFPQKYNFFFQHLSALYQSQENNNDRINPLYDILYLQSFLCPRNHQIRTGRRSAIFSIFFFWQVKLKVVVHPEISPRNSYF